MHPQNVNAHHKPSLPASCSWTSGMSQRLTYLQTPREDSKVCLTHLMGHGVHPIRFQWSSPPSCPRRNLIVLSHMTRSLPVSLLLKITSSRSRFWRRVWGARYLLGINTWESKGADAGWPGEAIELQRRPNKRSQELWADSCPWECPHTRPDACASTPLSHSPDAGSPRREWPWARWLWETRHAWSSWQLKTILLTTVSSTAGHQNPSLKGDVSTLHNCSPTLSTRPIGFSLSSPQSTMLTFILEWPMCWKHFPCPFHLANSFMFFKSHPLL